MMPSNTSSSSSGFLAAAVSEDSDFSIDNIPFGIGTYTSTTSGRTYRYRCMTAIGDHAVDLAVLQDARAFDDIVALDQNVFSYSSLNAFMDCPPEIWSRVRKRLQDLFSGRNNLLQSNPSLQKAVLQDLYKVQMSLPAEIGDYTDFYSSREHATNVGTMFRGKDNALQPNWLHLPVGYHGRASTVFCSGQDIVRPCGQLQKDPDDLKQGSIFGPCKLLDFELEVAFFVGNTKDDKYITGSPLTMEQAKRRIFGFVLMNDWSARDIQKWEYVPLGPFTSKNFATTISPWIITYEALQAFQGFTSAVQQDDPIPLDYLQDPDYSSFDVQLSVSIQSEAMSSGHCVCRSNFRNLYWNAAQQLVHHSVTGCLMRTGDLLGSGTISGTPENSFGSMLELSWKGSKSVALNHNGDGENRKFLNDGDTVVMTGNSVKPNHGRVGFGECRGKILAAGSKVEVRQLCPIQYECFSLYAPKASNSWPVEIVFKAKGVPYDLESTNEATIGLEFMEIASGIKVSIDGTLSCSRFLDRSFSTSKSLFPKDPMDEAIALRILEVIFWAEQTNNHKLGLDMVHEIILRQKQISFGGPFAMGGYSPSIVECFLFPFLVSVRINERDLKADYPELDHIFGLCEGHEWFRR